MQRIKQLQKGYFKAAGIDEGEYPLEVYQRKEKIDLFDKLICDGCSEDLALEAIGVSRATIFRYKKLYKEQGIEGLVSHSRRPHKIRVRAWDAKTELFVWQVREKYPVWGKNKIKVILKREYGKKLSTSTVGRILRKGIEKHKIYPVSFYTGQFKARKPRIFNGYAQRWEKGMKANTVGELIQVDHAVVKLPTVGTFRHFTAVCPITRWTVQEAYHQATSNTAAFFLEKLINQYPGEIISIQVDGGSEFMGEFEETCSKHSVLLYVLPPRSPEYNGKVERGNRTAKEEFYALFDGKRGLEPVREQLRNFTDFFNNFRPHQGLQYQTPAQYWKSIGREAFKSHMY